MPANASKSQDELLMTVYYQHVRCAVQGEAVVRRSLWPSSNRRTMVTKSRRQHPVAANGPVCHLHGCSFHSRDLRQRRDAGYE